MTPNFQIKTKILKVSGEIFEVPENFELVKDVSKKFLPSIIAKDIKSGQKFFVEKFYFNAEILPDNRLMLASLLAHFYLDSSKVAKLHHFIIPENFPSSNYVIKIVEHMEANLFLLIKSPQELTPNHVRYFLYQILLHLHYLHSHSLSLIYFRPRSFLVNSDCELKLSKPLYEFRINHNRIYQIEDYIENFDDTRWYLPPEYFIQNNLTLKSDMWSLGCIFYELVKRKPLFPGSNFIEMIKYQIEGLGKLDENDMNLIKSEKAKKFLMESQFKMNNLFDNIQGVCEDGMFILRNLLVFDPEKRMSAIECLMHPYFEEFFVEEDLFVEVKSFESIFDALFMDKDQILWRLGELGRN